VTLQPAWAALDISPIVKLYATGRAREAYDLARRHLTEGEGDPLFDYYHGLAAIDSGHISAGVFALERVLIANPRDDRARLELARGYFLLEEDLRARREFQAVLEPPPGVVATIQRHLDAIRLRERRYKTSAAAYLEVGAGTTTTGGMAGTFVGNNAEGLIGSFGVGVDGVSGVGYFER